MASSMAENQTCKLMTSSKTENETCTAQEDMNEN
jgi:hypothetical protein